jgi:hypothetical protein
MEGLAAGASGIAVFSIAIQLTDSLIKLSDFIETIQEAPEDVKFILSDLRLLSLILDEVQLQPVNANSNDKTVLNSLQRQIASFTALANRYTPGLNSESRRIRKWTAIKVASKRGKFKKYWELLNNTKITLILALQVFQ